MRRFQFGIPGYDAHATFFFVFLINELALQLRCVDETAKRKK